MPSQLPLFLTVNSRLARHLLNFFQTENKTRKVFTTPNILPINTWLERQFHETNLAGKILLNDFQEHCLWQTIITESEDSPELLQPKQTAQLIKQAWRFLNDWAVPPDELREFQTQQETRCLLSWIDNFKKRCKQNNWITQAQIIDALIDKHAHLHLPEAIQLIGFDDIPPKLHTFLEQIGTQTTITRETLEAPDTISQKAFFPDNEAEIRAMALWAKENWIKNPKENIACVIPDLQKQAHLVRSIFTDVFCISHILPSARKETVPFNLSAGESLAQHEMIRAALLMLKWSTHSLPIQHIATLLQSPYLCQNESEMSMGALMDAKLREKNQHHIHAQTLFEVLAPLQAAYPQNTWSKRWRAFITIAKDTQDIYRPSEWTAHASTLLQTLKWPGQHTQDSETFQYLERFKKLLLQFSQLDILYPQVSHDQALDLLMTLVKQTIFQPKSHQEPIQIMGVLEASGLTVDKLWVMGLHNDIWPAPTKPNPFIPFLIQQQYQMPHATAARELHFCEQVTERLKQSAKTVIFSVPLQHGDQSLQPSPLLAEIPTVDANTLFQPQTHNALETVWQSRQLESLSNDSAPPVHDPSQLRGGSHILKLQATCPFKAFATIRLEATPLDTPQLGLDGATRGTLAHHVLYLLWGKLKDQATLNRLTEEELATLINTTITEAIEQSSDKKDRYFWSIEKQRLKQLITDWLELEKDRPYFRVSQRETPAQLTINQLPLKLRIDRVDQLADGSYLLIDYKTGLSTTTHWFQERLTDPQLPLYATFTKTEDQQSYTGLAFAQVRSGALAFKGVVSETHAYANEPATGFSAIHRTNNALNITRWDALRSHWQHTLTQLAEHFCQGDAIVDPVNPQACAFCDLHGLCRQADLNSNDSNSPTTKTEQSLLEASTTA